MHPDIEKLINIAKESGELTEEQKEVILRKAEKLGEDVDEVEMILETLRQKPTIQEPETVGEKMMKCPNCGEIVSGYSLQCPACGYVILPLVRELPKINNERNEHNNSNDLVNGLMKAKAQAQEYGAKVEEAMSKAHLNKNKGCMGCLIWSIVFLIVCWIISLISLPLIKNEMRIRDEVWELDNNKDFEGAKNQAKSLSSHEDRASLTDEIIQLQFAYYLEQKDYSSARQIIDDAVSADIRLSLKEKYLKAVEEDRDYNVPRDSDNGIMEPPKAVDSICIEDNLVHKENHASSYDQ